MRKRINLVFILLLGIVMTLMLVACNQKTPNKLPDDIGSNSSSEDDGLTPSLSFEFPVELNSVFNSISLDHFVLEEYVTYSIEYANEAGEIKKVVKGGGLKTEMVDEDCRQYLTKAGHHDIKVTVPLDDSGKTVKGGFKLHLKDSSGVISLAKYTFNLRDINGGGVAYPYFASNIDSDRGIATKNLEVGVEISSWSEFISLFKMSLSGKALESVTAQGKTYDATGRNFPLVISGDLTFDMAWTDDIVNVKYDLNVPKDAVKLSTAPDPKPLFAAGGKYGNVTAARRVGPAVQPDDEEINVYNGYYFGGWFNKADGKLWRFSNAVGETDLELVAKWVLADYTFTIYPMGGGFAKNLQASTSDNGTVISKNNAERLGYIIIESSSRFGLSDGSLNRIMFTGFHYGISYDRYVAEVTINPAGEKVMLKFSEFYRPKEADQTILVKGDGDYLKTDDLYSDYQCTEPLERGDSNVNAEQPVTYIKWMFNEPEAGANYQTLFDSRISDYYRELAFKGGIDVLADGSLRLRQVADWAINELIVPEYLMYGDTERPITEIGEEALANMKALTLVDMSRASKLTTIGKQAFAYDDSLSEIIMPEDNAISLIGDRAFRGTDFENNYYDNHHGAEFIVIGDMIYKYVGRDKAEIDLSNPSVYYTEANSPNMSQDERNRFNAELTRVTSIEDGAFALCPSLSVLSIPAGLTAIKNNALSGLTYFRTLNLPQSGSKLLNIGESAFDGTQFLSERGSLYDGNINAIIIGNVYYRLINKTATRARIPASRNDYAITHIAPRAFLGCSELEDIVFDDVTKITEVGKEAFLDTKYVKVAKQGDNFTEVNGILTHYYGPTKNANESNLIVPSRVTRIGTYAFGKQAEYFNTLQINASVKKIDNYAFAGARMLVSIIFPEVGISGSVLTNAPELSEYAFAGENGEMNGDTMLYFSKAVIGLFNDLEEGRTSTTDAITLQWFNLYKLNKAHFIVEDISSIIIDSKIISTNLLKTGKTASAFTDTYGTGSVVGALIITSNTGVARRADLSWSGNGMEIIEITNDPTSKYFSLWREGEKRYVITYKYNGETTGCPTEADDDRLFIVTIHNDVKGNPTFFSSTNYPHNESKIDLNKLTADGNMWFEGLDSQVPNSEIPTFYTSNPGLNNVVFVYRDILNNEVRINPSRIDNLRVNSEADKAFATIYVNFYGLGTYVFDFEYAVKRSKFEAIEQTMEVAVPINANSAQFLGNYSVNLIGEDGNKEAFALTRSNFTVKKVDGKDTTVVDTSTLGMHTITIEYTKNDAKNRLEFDVHYTVILEADENLFTYDILNKSHKTAIITKCKAATDITTIVLPSRCEINGEIYTVTQLGRLQGQYTGVFEGYDRLSSVYLSETIENIGVNTFRGCIRLQNVFTAVQAASSPVVIPVDDTHFAKAGDSFKEKDESGVEWTVTPVKLLTLANVNMRASSELIIANDYVVNATEHTKYRIVAVEKDMQIAAEFDKIDVYLPDTIYNAVSLIDANRNPISPIYYSSGSNFMIKTVNRAPELLDYIGVGAFNGCISLVSIDLSKSVKLSLIGSLAFANTGLKSIDLSANTVLVEIGNQVFENCAALGTVKLHGGIRQIGANAFSGAELLTSIEGLSNSLVQINSLAFNRCKSLYRLDLYPSLTSMGSDAFSGCRALTIYCHFAADAVPSGWSANWNGDCAVVFDCDSNDVAKDKLIYVVEDGIRYALNTETKQATVAWQAYALEGTVTILASVTYKGETYDVTSIKASAFEGNDRITDVTVTSKLKLIDANAFKGCTNLATFTITGDNNLESIASTAFENCDSLARAPQVGA